MAVSQPATSPVVEENSAPQTSHHDIDSAPQHPYADPAVQRKSSRSTESFSKEKHDIHVDPEVLLAKEKAHDEEEVEGARARRKARYAKFRPFILVSAFRLSSFNDLIFLVSSSVLLLLSWLGGSLQLSLKLRAIVGKCGCSTV